MTLHGTKRASLASVRVVRVTVLGVALGLGTLGACGDGSSGGNGSNSGPQPSTCPPTPCTPGAVCYEPAAGENCNGTWYCWSDMKWRCQPPDSGGPGDASITFESSAPESSPAEGGSDGGDGGG